MALRRERLVHQERNCSKGNLELLLTRAVRRLEIPRQTWDHWIEPLKLPVPASVPLSQGLRAS